LNNNKYFDNILKEDICKDIYYSCIKRAPRLKVVTMDDTSENNIHKSSMKATKVLLEVISNHVKNHTNGLLNSIAKDYNLNFDELKDKYSSIPITIDIGKSKKKNAIHGPDGQPAEPKKRGRKKKQREELIETEEYEFNGTTYLVDTDNNVYTYNIEQPVYVGTKLIDGRIKFIQTA
jgi:hypothetical protein